MKPICSTTPAFFAASMMASHSASVSAIGFSRKTCLPAFAAATAKSRCVKVGVVMTTASNAPQSSASLTSAKLRSMPKSATALAAVSRDAVDDGGKLRSGDMPRDGVGMDAAGAAGADQADADAVPAARSFPVQSLLPFDVVVDDAAIGGMRRGLGRDRAAQSGSDARAAASAISGISPTA